VKDFRSFRTINQSLRDGNLSCRAIVEHYLENIQKHDHLNVFLEVYADEAIQHAEQIDAKLQQGKAGRLAGMVIGIKDVLCYQDHGLQASSKILQDFHSQFNGTAISRLIAEDAIIIGRQNCDEFAMGSSNENSAFGPTRNGVGENRVPGGSSGASAVSVQMELCTAALGSDTGGSVRQPAAFCGVVGLKPTYSRISRYGLLAYASSFDTIGIFTNNIEDNALLLEIIAGQDDFDSTVSHEPVPAYSQQLGYKGKARVAYIAETLENEGLNTEVKERTLQAIDLIRKDGHEVEAVHFPLLKYLLPTYYILTMAEASSNLSRYDGVKYGYRTPHAHNLEQMYKISRSEAFGEEVKSRIMLGTFVLSASYYDAYYTKAQKVRRLLQEATFKILDSFDFIVLPTTPTTAFKIGETASPLEMYLADLFTVQASIAGIPAISIPNGKDQEGMPIGLQLMASNFGETKLLAFSNYLMQKII